MKMRWILTAAAVLAAAALATAILTAATGAGFGPGVDRMTKELGLDDRQKAAVETAREAALRKNIELRKDLALKRLDFKKEIGAEHPDRARVFALVDDLSKIRTEMTKNRISALLDTKAVLTPEQQEKWRDLGAARMDERRDLGERRDGSERRGRGFHRGGGDFDDDGEPEPPDAPPGE